MASTSSGERDVVGERDAAPAAAVVDAAVARELLARPERDDHAAGLEEDDVVLGRGTRAPAERLVERPRAREIGDAERDEADALLHPGMIAVDGADSYKTAMRARLALLGIAAAVVAPAAHGVTPQPQLVVHGRTARATSEIVLRHVATVSSALVLVPAGYTLTLGQPEGTPLGSASADLLVDGVAKLVTGTPTVAPAGTPSCDGAVTRRDLDALARRRDADARDAHPRGGHGARAGPRVPRRVQVDRLTLQLASTVLAPPTQPARPVWEALISQADGSQVASVATLVLPAKLTLRATYQPAKHLIALSGTVLEGGAAAAQRRVVVSVGAKASTLTTIGATRSHDDGTWRGVITNVKRTLFVQAQVVVPETNTTATACTPPTLTAPCVSATRRATRATSAAVRVAVARK